MSEKIHDEIDKEHLSQLLATSNEPAEKVKSQIAKSQNISQGLLDELLADENDEVRFHALCNPKTPFAVYKHAVLTSELSNKLKWILVEDTRMSNDAEIFHFLWKNVPKRHLTMTNMLDFAYRRGISGIDPDCLGIVSNAIINDDIKENLKEMYAKSHAVSTAEVLDTLKDDPSQAVIIAISDNPSASVETHRYLLTKHKSITIKTNIARVTQDNDLLNEIYRNTTSRKIREVVEANKHFVNLYT